MISKFDNEVRINFCNNTTPVFFKPYIRIGNHVSYLSIRDTRSENYGILFQCGHLCDELDKRVKYCCVCRKNITRCPICIKRKKK